MMKKSEKQHLIQHLPTLILLVILAVTVFTVLMKGIVVYRDIENSGRQSYERLTAEQFLITKVRQAVNGKCVETQQIDETSAILISEEYDGIEYFTQIYDYDGYLSEFFAEKGTELMPEDGQQVLPLNGVDFKKTGNILVMSINEKTGKNKSVIVSLRGEETDNEE